MIFGVEHPKFIASTGPTVLLKYSVVMDDKPEYKNLMIESEVDESRIFVPRAIHWLFRIKYHLYKHVGLETTTFNEISMHLYDTVTFFRHKDGFPFKDSDGNTVPFFFESIVPIYITRTDYKDGLILTFKSTRPVVLPQPSAADEYHYLVDGSGNYIVDGDGENIIGKEGASSDVDG